MLLFFPQPSGFSCTQWLTTQHKQEAIWAIWDVDRPENGLVDWDYSNIRSISTCSILNESCCYRIQLFDFGYDGICCDEKGNGYFDVYYNGSLVIHDDGMYGNNRSYHFALGHGVCDPSFPRIVIPEGLFSCSLLSFLVGSVPETIFSSRCSHPFSYRSYHSPHSRPYLISDPRLHEIYCLSKYR